MILYREFADPVEHFSRDSFQSLQLARNPSDESFVDDDQVEDRLDRLAAEFVDRYRRGECPPIAEYANRYPELADEIRDLFPTIAQMEGLKVQIEHDQQPSPVRGMIAGRVPMSQLGDFRIIREIGRGGMGVVYEAEQMSLGRRVAIKALPLLSVSQPELVRRFQREARTAARLHHTNIVPVFGVGEAEGFHYYVMQLIDGIGLDTLMDDNGNTASDSSVSQLATEFDTPCDEESRDESLRDESLRDEGREGQGEECRSAIVETPVSKSAQYAEAPAANRSPAANPSAAEQASVPQDELLNDNSTSLSLPSHIKVRDRTSDLQASFAPTSGSAATSHSVANLNDTANPDTSTNSAAARSVTSLPGTEGSTSSTVSMRSPEKLSFAEIVDVGIQAADALQYAHAQGTLHRDIKPGNLMLDRNGVVWVTDFGLAKAMEGDDITQTENVVGTVRYMAPEQFRGQTDARCDIYSLGLTLYELITRKRAWSARSRSSLINEIMDGELVPLRSVAPNVPRDLETIILKATARDVQHRYQSAGELAEDLRRYYSDRSILARRVGPVEKLWGWSRRNPVVAALSLATTLSLLLFAAAAVIGYTAERQQRERAEATSELALEALDRIFEKFAPGDSIATSSSTLAGGNGSGAEHAVLSPEAARLLAGMLEFYERLASEADDAPELILKCAQARQRVGDIYQRLGKYESAIASYRVAITDYEGLGIHADSGSFGDPAVIKAGMLNGIGACQLMLAQQDESQASHREAMTLLESLSEEARKRPNVRFEQARTHSLLARRRGSSDRQFQRPLVSHQGGKLLAGWNKTQQISVSEAIPKLIHAAGRCR
jgi:serine/threonine protein kinase